MVRGISGLGAGAVLALLAGSGYGRRIEPQRLMLHDIDVLPYQPDDLQLVPAPAPPAPEPHEPTAADLSAMSAAEAKRARRNARRLREVSACRA